MIITQAQLREIMGCSGTVAMTWCDPVNAVIQRFNLDTRMRTAAFLAQVGHESTRLTRLVENLNYSAEGLVATWPKRFDAKLAAQVARKPEQIANIVYADRLGNGSQASGDGWEYRGRGLIQITGKSNYRDCGAVLGLDLLKTPSLLEIPTNAAMSAGWFWSMNGLNALADAGQFETLTRRINGGLNGLADRKDLLARAMRVLA